VTRSPTRSPAHECTTRSDTQSPGQGSDALSGDDGPDSFDASPLEDRRALVLPRSTIVSRPQKSAQFNRILVAEDNIVNQKVLVRMLKDLGYANVVIAINGKIAVDMVKESFATDPIDLIFMDCLMPEMDGWEATRQIRKWEAEKNAESVKAAVDYVPARLNIIALTAHVTMRDRDECLDSGMDDFLVKPVNIVQVESALHQWLPASDLPTPVAYAQRWPHGVVSGNVVKVPSRLGGDTRSERSYTSYNSSVASSALEEVSFILQAKLRSEDGMDPDESIVLPSLRTRRSRGQVFTGGTVSPLIVMGSTSRARSVQSDCSPSVSIFAESRMKPKPHTRLRPTRLPIDATMEQADLPEEGVSNTHLYPLLHSLRANTGSGSAGSSPEDRVSTPLSATIHGIRTNRSSPLIGGADLKMNMMLSTKSEG
jgi:CheY-like chemotaxis protein